MKRLYLLMTICLPLFLLGLGRSWWQPVIAQEPLPPLMIHEWSQGHGGAKEWVELLATEQVDLRGWSLGDSSAGDLLFTEHDLWTAVPAGTRIVIYNGNAPDDALPPDDFITDDCILVLPHTQTDYFAGSWPSFANSTHTDNPHLQDANQQTVHDFSDWPGTAYHAGANEAAQFVGDGVTQAWQLTSAELATPAQGNSPTNTTWLSDLCTPNPTPETADLAVSLTAPAQVLLTETIPYEVVVQNVGALTAVSTTLTQTLPYQATVTDHDSPFAYSYSDPYTLVWSMGALPSNTVSSWVVTVSVPLVGEAFTHLHVTSHTTETHLLNNVAIALTQIRANNQPSVLIEAVLFDGYETGDTDEAIRLRNTTEYPIDVGGWMLSDGVSQMQFPAGAMIDEQSAVWLTKDNTAFTRQFGFLADWETEETSPMPQLTGNWLGLSNSGDELFLYDAEGNLVDVLVYGAGDVQVEGWQGTAVQPYASGNLFAREGQLLYRQRTPQGELRLDSNTASDWAQTAGLIQYPGWDIEQYQIPFQVTQTHPITIAIAPDNGYHALTQQIHSAQQTIQIQSLTFENLAIAEALVQAVQRGVSVTVLLEGEPSGGVPAAEKYICQQLDAVGGACWFMFNDPDQQIYDRYRYLHAKLMIIDGERIVIGSENLSPNSLPDDDKSDGTWGRRGVLLITSEPHLVAYAQTLFARDFDPAHHQDLVRWHREHPEYGLPPTGYFPIQHTGGTTYTVRYPDPLPAIATHFELVQAPDNSLHPTRGLLGLVNRAQEGDEVLVQQLIERPFWNHHPNPRLTAYIEAARRGATVRLMLDAYFDDPSLATSNQQTCQQVQQIAQQEQLDLHCQVTNPTGLGIHNKMVLVQLNGDGYVHVGSINGTEQSSKGNRELALQIQSNQAYAYLAEMFRQDQSYTLYLPVMGREMATPARHLLISEVLYNPAGADSAEFIELFNPTGLPIDLSQYTIGDARYPTDYEDVRRFPAGAVIQRQQTIVIATTATAFYDQYDFNPHFEIFNSDETVPDMVDDPAWGDPSTFLQLGNSGDEVILRTIEGDVVDLVVYGTGVFGETVACAPVSLPQASLERYPPNYDTDDCGTDFREWPFPNPNALPE